MDSIQIKLKFSIFLLFDNSVFTKLTLLDNVCCWLMFVLEPEHSSIIVGPAKF